jgi:hypothetical protein
MKIETYPQDGEPDYSHMMPIVDFLPVVAKGITNANPHLGGGGAE